MLDLFQPEQEQNPLEDLQTLYAPDVFIDSCEVYSNRVIVYYRLEDKTNRWVNNQIILNNLNLYISCNDILFKESLNAVKKNSFVKNGIITGFATFSIKAENIVVQVKTGNDKLEGNIVTEQVLAINNLVKNTLEDTTYEYINKNKDLRLLDIFELSLNPSIESVENQKKELYISYTPDKKANIAYIFNLEKYLNSNSHTYKILKKYENFKNNILNNSSIDLDNTTFYKKSINLGSKEYSKINSKPIVYQVNSGDPNGDYVISCTDMASLYDKDAYSVRLKIAVKDYSNQFFKKEIVDNLKLSKTFLLSYKQKFELLQKNTLIEDKNSFFYQYKYENELENVKNTVENLSTIYSFYTGKQKDKFYTLFLSILHPLTTHIGLIETLTNSVNNIQRVMDILLQEINVLGESTIPFYKENSLQYVIDFKDEASYIDYNYDPSYGYEVMSIDNASNRKLETFNGLRLVTTSAKNARRVLESSKYLLSTDPATVNQVKYFSFSSVDLGEKSYYLLYNDQFENTISYNEIFIKLNEYNNFNFKYDNVHSRYFQLLEKNIYIKSAGERNNQSVNNLEKSTIFDPNIDTKQNSLEFLTSTGLAPLYLMIDDSKFIPFTTEQINITLPDRLSSDDLFSKPEKIILYNSFFEDIEVFSGTNYSLFEIRDYIVNQIFNKKLKIFNKYYILEHEGAIQQTFQQEPKYLFEKELLFNVPSKYLNRNIEQQKLLLTTDDI